MQNFRCILQPICLQDFFLRHKFCTNLFFHTFLLLELIYDLRKIYIVISKITKIEARSDWPRGVFAREYVNMVLTLRCFPFRANQASTNLKNVLSRKTRQD